jgi:hypothetical protein
MDSDLPQRTAGRWIAGLGRWLRSAMRARKAPPSTCARDTVTFNPPASSRGYRDQMLRMTNTMPTAMSAIAVTIVSDMVQPSCRTA